MRGMTEGFEKIMSAAEGIPGTFPEIQLVYLFGSRAQEWVGPKSDYDFAVLAESVTSTVAFQAEVAHEFCKHLGSNRVDVVLLKGAPIDLAYAVVSTGICLYQKNVEARIDYEAYVLGRYFDFLPVLRAQRKETIRGEDNAYRIQRYREALGRTERALGKIATAQG